MNVTKPAVLAALTAVLASGAGGAPPLAPREVAAIPVALLADLGSGETLYARNPDLPFVPASVTKAMTAYVAFGLLHSGKLDEHQIFAVDRTISSEWKGKGTSLFLSAGAQVPVDVLIRGITTVSANDAAITLAQGYAASVPAWAGLMNAEAHRLGMTGSHFGTPNGWPDNGATYVTARDLVRLGDALVTRYPDYYRRYFGQKRFVWNGFTQVNKDPTLGVVTGADGIKTGHTAEAGFNFLGSAMRGERRLMMVIAGARSEAERASAARALLEWGFSAWQTRLLFPAGTRIGEAQVQAGAARSVGLIAGRAVYATLPRGATTALSLRLVYHGPLVAPITRGAQVAELDISSGEGALGRVPLYAAAAVGAAGPLDRLWNGLAGLIT